MKFFKITWAEIKKILLKPTFYILVGCLFVAIIISAFLFNPSERDSYPSQISGSTLSSISSNFNSQNSSILDSKANLDKRLNEKINFVMNFNSSLQADELKNRVKNFKTTYFDSLEYALSTGSVNINHLTDIQKASRELLEYFNTIQTSTEAYNFIIKKGDFQNFNNTLTNILSALPSTYDDTKALENDRNALVERAKLIITSFKVDVANMNNVCQDLQKITFSQEFLDYISIELKNSVDEFAKKQSEEISYFVLENGANENNKDQVLKLRSLINDYKATYEIALQTIDNLVNIQRLNSRNANETAYLGFENTSLYKLQEETNFYIYSIANQIKYSNAITALNFNQNSGLKTNGYDFAYYLSAVASLILTLIMIYLACISFSAERHDGLARMNLTKPCSRTKLYFAKISSLLVISLVAHLLLGFIFLIIGVCVYGPTSGSLLIAVFSSSSAFGVAPFWNFIYKIFSLFISNAFYILLTSFIAVLFSNPVFSVVVSYLVYIFALITSTLLSTSAFIKFLPFIHTDLSFFFGGGTWGSAFLSSTIYSGASFALSFVYLILFSALAIVGSVEIFKRQEL